MEKRDALNDWFQLISLAREVLEFLPVDAEIYYAVRRELSGLEMSIVPKPEIGAACYNEYLAEYADGANGANLIGDIAAWVSKEFGKPFNKYLFEELRASAG